MKIISSLLIANRGEIASRIIRTCRKMGIRSIAIFSDADRDALFVEQADVGVFIGASAPSESYLDQDKIIAAAKKTGADAIHPGYGFLSENVAFAERCQKENIIFIGPHPEAMKAMSSKSKAKTLMVQHGVPVVPGYQGADQSIETLTEGAKEIGFPVLLKATAGGGGKGMRIVHNDNEMKTAVGAAKREAKKSFGDDELIVEKYIASGRHIEFQIFGDQHGNTIHLLERECTIQRRYQKVIEESPSPVLSDKLRQKMGTAAVKAAKALEYDNAGTVEFILNDVTKEFYFLEVNTRLQVEHPVTEEVTGLDLVQMQIESAQGMPLSIQQEEIKGKGYAIECRLYAEDPANDFLPVTGTIQQFEVPLVDGLRMETAIRNGSEISIYYDPLIAKIIVWDKSRHAAHRKMQYVLCHLVCLGMTTNQSFLLQILTNPDFQQGDYDTHFIKKNINLTTSNINTDNHNAMAAIAACLHQWNSREESRTLLRTIPSGWRNSFNDYQQEKYLLNEEELLVKYRFQNNAFQFFIKEKEYAVRLITDSKHDVRIEIDGLQYAFHIAQSGNEFFIHNEETGPINFRQKERFLTKQKEKVAGGYEAPMPSQIIKVLVEPGQEVKEGDGLIVLSSMKMENTIYAFTEGKVEEVYVTEGGNVEAGVLLLKLS